MRVAFVGVKRPFNELPVSVDTFVRFHLELPYYFSDEETSCYVTTVDVEKLAAGAELILETQLGSVQPDVVVHWRSWQRWAFDQCPLAKHVIQTCDHSYSREWIDTVYEAVGTNKCQGLICFETWHARNTQRETGLPWTKIFTQLHLGVDTEIYRPKEKDPFKLLWASDPGRGLGMCLQVFQHLFSKDRRYRLHVTYPDYVNRDSIQPVSHPGIVWHHGLKNGPELWDLFNTSAFVPYTSCFMEPSSRVHRQAQAAGCCLVYPEDRGSPSELIMDGRTGLLAPNDNPLRWAEMIHEERLSGHYKDIGRCARNFAVTEDWSVQRTRFKLFCEEMWREHQ